MGIGPVAAIPQAFAKQVGLTIDDIDLIELNEAIASIIGRYPELGLDASKINPNGGAISLGHPLAVPVQN